MTPAKPPEAGPPIRRVDAERGAGWWGDGWRLFKTAPLVWIAIVIVWLVVSVALTQAGTVGNIASMLLTPVLSAGVLMAAREQDTGGNLRFETLFAGLSGGRFGPLLMLGIFNLLLSAIVLAIVAAAVIGVVGYSGLRMFVDNDVLDLASTDLTGLAYTILLLSPVLLIGFALISMAFWFAPGLVAVNRLAPQAALWLSFRANLTNIGAMLIYGLIGLAFVVLALATLGLGFFALGPVMAGSWYATWRDVFGEAAAGMAATPPPPR
ncbi:MAG TPA: BPSS1780 family membrane protein [Casimicrobiaceae bacterium]